MRDELPVLAGRKRRAHVHVHDFGQGVRFAAFRHAADLRCVFAVTAAAAVRAGDIHIGQKLHVQADTAGTVAGGAAQFAGVVGEVAGFVFAFFCVRRAGENFTQLIVHIGVCRNGGAHVDTDRRSIDELHLVNALGADRLHMRW